MKHARFFSLCVFIVLLGYGATGYYFLPMASFQGDLTRIGMLPESHFGWRKPQPAIDPNLMQQSSMQEADVLVIGDSFSDDRIWQAALTQRGLKVRTESWNRMRDICADFMPWLRAQGFVGKYVVLEYIERNLTSGLSRSVACQHMQYRPRSSTDAPRTPPEVSFDPDRSNRSGSMSVGIRTARNAMKYERLSGTPNAGFAMSLKGARIARVKDGCDLFSHRSCNDALFLGSDEAGDLGGEVMKNIGILDSRLEDVTPVWVVVPNKSTAYLYSGKQFWNEAERRFGAPNLLRMTQRAIDEKVVDLYPANSTHFSATGYLLMGEEIYRSIQRSQERPR